LLSIAATHQEKKRQLTRGAAIDEPIPRYIRVTNPCWA